MFQLKFATNIQNCIMQIIKCTAEREQAIVCGERIYFQSPRVFPQRFDR